jgi:hypothetical protein
LAVLDIHLDVEVNPNAFTDGSIKKRWDCSMRNGLGLQARAIAINRSIFQSRMLEPDVKDRMKTMVLLRLRETKGGLAGE